LYANYEMDMPKRYVDLSEDEMEYDGGFWNFVAGAVCSAISITCTIVAVATDNKQIAQAATIIGAAATAVGLALGVPSTLAAKAAEWAVDAWKLGGVAMTVGFTPVELSVTVPVTAATWPF